MKKGLFILLPIIVLGVGVALVFTGIIKIPGLNLGPQKKKAALLYTGDKDTLGKDKGKTVAKKDSPPAKTPAADTTQTPPAKTPPPKGNPTLTIENKPEVGAKKLAKLWNEIDASALKDITKDWKEKDLAGVLMKMDNGKVAEFLGILDAKRASNLSRELQKQASLVAQTTGP